MWLPIVVIAYFLNALSAVVDKFLLNKKIPQPAVYTFAIVTLGLLGLVLTPWGFTWIGFFNFSIALAGGILFTLALFYLFKALIYGETSRITPFIGGLSPVFVLLFSFFILSERLLPKQFIAFVFIVLGTLLLSFGTFQKKNDRKGYYFAILSAILFGISYTLTKYVYNVTPFISGFVWMRITTFIGGLLLLLWRVNRQAIFSNFKKRDVKTGKLFLLGQVSGSLSFLLINYTISLASVTLVNALQGLQYVFLLIMVLILSARFPDILKEKMHGWFLVQKIVAVVLVGLGLGFLF